MVLVAVCFFVGSSTRVMAGDEIEKDPPSVPIPTTGIFSTSTSILERDLYVVGDNVTITDSLEFAPHHKIVVWGNGVLNIDGAILNNARIVVKPGGRVNVTNGAIINLRDAKSFVLPKGARLRVTNGKILN